MRKHIPLISLLSLTAMLASAFPALGGEPAASSTVIYKQVGDRKLKLTIEKPADWKADGKVPAVVFFFGGGWVGGNMSQFKPQSEYLATRGTVGVRVEYRVIPKGDAGPPTICVQDAKSAMRYVRGHAKELGIDPQRIAAAGGSAGGHLAAATALLPGLDDPQDDLNISPRPDALILFNPVFDNGPGEWGYERVGARYKEFSPAHQINAKAPPTIVFLGEQDKLIPVKTVRDFATSMKNAGIRCEAFFYPGAGHGFFNKGTNGGRHFNSTLIETDRFLTSLGWLKGEPTLKGEVATAIR